VAGALLGGVLSTPLDGVWGFCTGVPVVLPDACAGDLAGAGVHPARFFPQHDI